MFTNRLRTASFNNREQTKTQEKEKNWDQRFVLSKIPPYDAFKDLNYLSLGLMKSKIKYERFLEKEKQKKLKLKTPRYTEHYVIDSQTGNKKSKEKNKNSLLYTFNKNYFSDNSKTNFAKTYSYKLTANKNEEKQLTSEENDLIEEFEIIKNMWSKLGVTRVYQENFVNLINSLDEPDSIKLYLSSEKKQMQKFKYELTLLLKKIIHRNDQISSLKQLISLYENILKEKKSRPENENENLDSLCNINENKITLDIHSCLLSLRITTINVVNQIKSFLMSNSYFLYMDKINLEKIKHDYYYDDEYLFNIKTDLDFVQRSVLNKIYEFDSFDGRDPFFLSFSKLKEEGQNNEDKQKTKKIKLEINKKLLEEIQNCIYFMQQSEILHKCKNHNKNNSNKNKVLEFLNYGNNNGEENIKKKSYGIGNLFKGNLEQDIIKLKMTKGYDRIFNFIKTNNSQPRQDVHKENRLKKSSKKKNIPLMTSQELKRKLSQYELLNELINEPNPENKNDEEFKKRDQEINIQKDSQYNKEKNEDSVHDNYNKEFKEIKQDENNKLGEKKDEKDNNENESKKESENNEEKTEKKKEINENENNEEKEQIETNEKENVEKKDEESEKPEIKDEKKEKTEEENYQKHVDSKILEELDAVIQHDIENNKEEITTYSTKFFTESLDKLSYLYNNYLSTNPNIYTSNTPNKSNDFLCGIYPKIIIAEKDKVNDDKIYGICGINFYIDDNKEYILKINHISVNENNEEILKKFIDLIENEIKYKIIEIELANDDRNEKDKLMELLKNKEYKEIFKDDQKVIMRKENENNNNNEIGSKINYNSLSVISLINRENNESLDKKITCFNKVMNPINLSLLIDKLKINDKYKVEIISSSNPKTSLIDILSKLENKVFDFISSQNNQCDNISEIIKNEIKPKNGFYYSIIQNALNIQMNTLMTVKLVNYLYNGITINIKNNIIKDLKYNGNLYCLSCDNKNIFIILYQYNDEFEQNLNQDNNNIYDQFTNLFNINIKKYISEVHNDNDDNNKKILWIPSFNIDTNLFSSGLEINKYINIINNDNVEMKIDEYNEFLKINYLPDDNNDKNVEMTLKSSDNDIVIKDKFLFGICHKEFLECCDTPVISLVNVTKDNFKSIK